MEFFNHLNMCDKLPSAGDVLVIRTRKSGSKDIMCQVKEIVGTGDDAEVILQKSTNSFFNWHMFNCGESWVYRVWNLGDVTLTTSSNSMNKFIDL